MCGRFTSLLSPELLVDLYGVPTPQELECRYNIAPTQEVLAVRQDAAGERYLSAVSWGLVPHWAKELSIGSKMINARCESVFEKPSFRQAIRTRRCIVPASGFYEWATIADGRIPHYITMQDGSPFSFAGIWESWADPDGHAVETCAILTTAANGLIETIHDRMPVILHPTEFDLWLDRTVNDQYELKRVFQPYPSDVMQIWPVSPFVNKSRHESSECIEPLPL
jgi:putative SOS response-associated peptidase YedK